jgi:hypothetical protein
MQLNNFYFPRRKHLLPFILVIVFSCLIPNCSSFSNVNNESSKKIGKIHLENYSIFSRKLNTNSTETYEALVSLSSFLKEQSENNHENKEPIKDNGNIHSAEGMINFLIMMKRLFSYENRLHPLLSKLKLLPNSEKEIPNALIINTIHDEIKEKLNDSVMRSLRLSMDHSLTEFFIALGKIADFKLTDEKFIFSLRNVDNQSHTSPHLPPNSLGEMPSDLSKGAALKKY